MIRLKLFLPGVSQVVCATTLHCAGMCCQRILDREDDLATPFKTGMNLVPCSKGGILPLDVIDDTPGGRPEVAGRVETPMTLRRDVRSVGHRPLRSILMALACLGPSLALAGCFEPDVLLAPARSPQMRVSNRDHAPLPIAVVQTGAASFDREPDESAKGLARP